MDYKGISKRLLRSPALILMLPGLIVPLLIKDLYHLHIVTMALIAGVSALGVRLILSAGHLSLGQGAFLAVGAYTSVSLVGRCGFSVWLALPLSGLVASLFALVIGWPALRLKGVYFAVLTFAVGEAVRLILINGGELTGGPSGIPGGKSAIKGIPPPDILAMPGGLHVEFNSKVPYYYLALILLVVTAVVMSRIQRSRTGTILTAIEQSDSLAESVGISVTKYKLLAFTTACFFSGLAGAFFAHYIRSITPEDFTFWTSADFVLYTIIGGKGSIFGPIIGAVGMLTLSSSIAFLERYQTIVYGGFTILVLRLFPDGLVSLPGLLLHYFRHSRELAEATKNHESNQIFRDKES